MERSLHVISAANGWLPNYNAAAAKPKKEYPDMKRLLAAALMVTLAAASSRAETTEEWIALGTRVHGGFGAFIPLGIKIGLDAVERLKAKPRELIVTYYDSDKSPCACFADGIAIATYASTGQRSLVLAPEKAPPEALAVAVIAPKKGGPGVKYTIPLSALPKLGQINSANPEPKARWDIVMGDNSLFQAEAIETKAH